MTALALIGGHDPTGGAGLLRDVAVANTRAPTLEQLVVCTAMTRQGHGEPASFTSTDANALAQALERVRSHPRLRAVKLGMVPEAAAAPIIELLAELRARPSDVRPWVVADPVMYASDGGRLGASVDTLRDIARRVDLLTPNPAEREALQVDALTHVAVLFKGEGVPDRPDRICDRLRLGDGTELSIERPRVSGPDPRGTGCALASAIACELANGRSLVTAVVAGVAWLDGARRRLQPGPDGRWHFL